MPKSFSPANLKATRVISEWLRQQENHLYENSEKALTIDFEQLAVLFHYALKERYRLSNCYLLNGSQDLRIALAQIKNAILSGDPCYIAIQTDNNIIPLYFLSIDGNIHVLIANVDLNIAIAIKSLFQDSIIHFLRSYFQLKDDTRSNVILTYKILQAFVKRGENIARALISDNKQHEEMIPGMTIYQHDIDRLIPFKVKKQQVFRDDASLAILNKDQVQDIVDEMQGVYSFSRFKEEEKIAIELKQVMRNDNKGGLHWPDTLNALKWRFKQDEKVEVVAKICETELIRIPLVIEAVMGNKIKKQFFVFTYRSDPEHMIGIVIDRQRKEMRIYDHGYESKNNSLKNLDLINLANKMGFKIVDGFPLSPFNYQSQNWECGVLAVNVIDYDIKHHLDSQYCVKSKIQIDLKVEAEKILIDANFESTYFERQKQNYLFLLRKWNFLFLNNEPAEWVKNKLWTLSSDILTGKIVNLNLTIRLTKLKKEQDQFLLKLELLWKSVCKNSRIEDWMLNEFKKLNRNIFNDPDFYNNILTYFGGLQSETLFDLGSKARTNLIGLLESIDYEDEDYQDYSNIYTYLSENFESLKKGLPGKSDTEKRNNLRQISYGRFFLYHHSVPAAYNLDTKSSIDNTIEKMEAENLAMFDIPEFQWLFNSMDYKRKTFFAHYLRQELLALGDIGQPNSLNMMVFIDDINKIAEGKSNSSDIQKIKAFFLKLVSIANEINDYKTMLNIINYCKTNRIESSGIKMLHLITLRYGNIDTAIYNAALSENVAMLSLIIEADKGTYDLIIGENTTLDIIRKANKMVALDIYLKHLESIFKNASDNVFLQKEIRQQVVYSIYQTINYGIEINFLYRLIKSPLIKDDYIHGCFYAEVMIQEIPNQILKKALETNLTIAVKANAFVYNIIKFQSKSEDALLNIFQKNWINPDLLSAENVTELLSTKSNKYILFMTFFCGAGKLNPQQMLKVLCSYETNHPYPPHFLDQIKQLLSLKNKPDLKKIKHFITYLSKHIAHHEFVEIIACLCKGSDDQKRTEFIKMATEIVYDSYSTSLHTTFFEKYKHDIEAMSSLFIKTINKANKKNTNINYSRFYCKINIVFSLKEDSHIDDLTKLLGILSVQLSSNNFKELLDALQHRSNHENVKNLLDKFNGEVVTHDQLYDNIKTFDL